MITPKDMGKKFKEEREKQGFSIEAVAARSRIHFRVLEDIENGVFDRIGSLYIKSFIKKYSLFLEMNTQEIMDLYDSSVLSPKKNETLSRIKNNRKKNEFLSGDNPSKKSTPLSENGAGNKKEISDENTSKKKKELQGKSGAGRKKMTLSFVNAKNIQVAMVALLSVLFVFLVLILFNMLSAKLSGVSDSLKAVAAKHQGSETGLKKNILPVQKKDEYNLEFKADDDVWLQIRKGDEKIFAGTVKKGKSVSWKFDSPIRIWTGKAENLECIYNRKKIGKIAKGVVKDIAISGQGIKIGDSWVVHND